MKFVINFCFLLFFFSPITQAQGNNAAEIWNTKVNGANGNPVDLQIVKDGSNGAYVFWIDPKYADTLIIMGEHLDANGVTKWSNNYSGKILIKHHNEVVPNRNFNSHFSACASSNGGFNIGYLLTNNIKVNQMPLLSLYIKKFGINGNSIWAGDGTEITDDFMLYGYFPINPSPDNMLKIWLLEDGNGGVFTAWTDYPFAYVQHLDATGTRLWPLNKPVFPAALNDPWPNGEMVAGIAQNQYGELAVFADDWRNGNATIYDTYDNMDVYTQLLAPNGDPLWGQEGILVGGNNTLNMQWADGIIGNVIALKDGSFLMVWRGNNSVAQRLSRNGIPNWSLNGINIPNGGGYESILPDEMGGAVVLLHQLNNLFCNALTADGNFKYPSGNVEVAYGTKMSVGNERTNKFFYATWQLGENILAQKISMTDGSKLWGDSGLLVCGRPDKQDMPIMQAGDDGSVIIVWYDYRDSVPGKLNGIDIYASKVVQNGTLPLKFKSFSTLKCNDQIQLHWQMANDESVTNFIIQKAFPNESFETIGNTFPHGNSTPGLSYFFNEKNPFSKINSNNTNSVCYRIGAVEKNGNIMYSNILCEKNTSSLIEISLQQNPAHQTAIVKIVSPIQESIVIKLVNLNGTTLYTKKAQKPLGDYVVAIPIQNLAAGSYFIVVKAGTNKKILQLVKQ